MRQWDLEGLTVQGNYMGDFPVTGRVALSRVQWGGEVCHHVVLDAPIVVYGATRDRVVLEHKFIDHVMSNC